MDSKEKATAPKSSKSEFNNSSNNDDDCTFAEALLGLVAATGLYAVAGLIFYAAHYDRMKTQKDADCYNNRHYKMEECKHYRPPTGEI